MALVLVGLFGYATDSVLLEAHLKKSSAGAVGAAEALSRLWHCSWSRVSCYYRRELTSTEEPVALERIVLH